MSSSLPRQGDHRCELCGTPVKIVSSREGTAHYEPTGYAKHLDAPATVRETPQSLHGLLAWIAGMCADEEPHHLIAEKVMEAKEIVHQLEQRASALEAAIDDYALWEPGRAGHAAAHRRLMEARRG